MNNAKEFRGINITYELDEKGRIVIDDELLKRGCEFSTGKYSEGLVKHGATMRVNNIFDGFYSAVELYEATMAQGNERVEGFRKQIRKFEEKIYGYLGERINKCLKSRS